MRPLTCIIKAFLAMGTGMTLLSGCQSQWTQEPGFGSSVTQAVDAQKVNPGAPGNLPVNQAGMDGVAAKSSMDNYQRSLIRNTQPGTTGSGSFLGTNALGGSGASSGGSGSTPSGGSTLMSLPSN
ncbi:MAG: hypothetical protein Q7J51_01330 [Sheuella sp.]|nr:hypothetical protein [Sheuella sp.]